MYLPVFSPGRGGYVQDASFRLQISMNCLMSDTSRGIPGKSQGLVSLKGVDWKMLSLKIGKIRCVGLV